MRVVGKVESLWRYPVKSMSGEELEEAFLGFPGVYGDRLYAFHNAAAPRSFPWLTAREHEPMLLYRPRYRRPDRTMAPRNLADAEALGSGVTPMYGDWSDFALDVETPSGERLAIDDPRLATLLGDELTLLRSERALTDCRPVSIFSVQTVRRLGDELGAKLDKRRFRANLYVDLASGEGFGEDALVGRTLHIGPRAAVSIVSRDARCKMITLDPDTARPNPDLIKLLARDHEGKAGIYGAVLAEGVVRTGDTIGIAD